MSEVFIARQDTLLETNENTETIVEKVDLVQESIGRVENQPKSGGGQIVWPGAPTSNRITVAALPTDTNGYFFFFYINEKSTKSGVGELHIIATHSNYHYIWDGIQMEKQPNLPRVFTTSASAICGMEDAKSIHFLGGTTDDTRHDRYDVKTRTWTREAALPGNIKNGKACGEEFDASGREAQPSNLIYFVTGDAYVYVIDDAAKTCTYKGRLNRMPFSINEVVRRGEVLLVCDFGFSDCETYDVKTGVKALIPAPWGKVNVYASFGAISKLNREGVFYYFDGVAFVQERYNVFGKSSRNFSFIRNSVVHIISAYSIIVDTSCYTVYLPKGTKIFNAKRFKQNYVDSSLSSFPYFPCLRIEGDAFVVDESGIVQYSNAYVEFNLNTGESNGKGLAMDGFHVEIGSGE